MKNGFITYRCIISRSVKSVFVLALSSLAFCEQEDDLVNYSFSHILDGAADLNQIVESHLVATDIQGHIESHPIRLSSNHGRVEVEARFVSKKGLTSAIAWLISKSGEEWSVVGSLEVEKSSPPAEAAPTQTLPTKTEIPEQIPSPSISAVDSVECTSSSYDAFILAHDVENIKASLAALAVEDPLQAALQAREAELSELLRGIAENESVGSAGKEERLEPPAVSHSDASGGQGSEIPLGVQKKELEKLKQDREALEDELAAWGVM